MTEKRAAMTPQELDALDARAARAMGYEIIEWSDGTLWAYKPGTDCYCELPHPTRSWADCGLMLRFLRKKGLVGAGVYNDEGTWYGTIRMSDHGYAGDAEELLPAIVLAACEALERGKGD